MYKPKQPSQFRIPNTAPKTSKNKYAPDTFTVQPKGLDNSQKQQERRKYSSDAVDRIVAKMTGEPVPALEREGVENSGLVQMKAELTTSSPQDAVEQEAHEVAHRVISGEQVEVGQTATANIHGNWLSDIGKAEKAEKAVKPEIDATEEATGKYVADKMDAANKGPLTADKGIHYARNYRDSYQDRWKDDYIYGYADPNFFERVDFMDWMLKPNVSASAAIKSWLKGLTIAECLTTVVAIEYDTIRAAIGDAKFDEIFGTADKEIPGQKRLRIATPSATITIPLYDYMIQTDASAKDEQGKANNRPVKIGEWYYFYNHPKYLLKHPAGEWQGENSIYMGKDDKGTQLWSGLGTVNSAQTDTKVTEDEMLSQMVDAYNGERDPDDNKKLEGIKQDNGGELPKEYVFEDEGGKVPREIDKKRILNDPPYTIDKVTRKGGFSEGSGATLNLDKVKKLRG